MNKLLRLICLLMALALLPTLSLAEDAATEPVYPFRDLTAAEITAEMGTGWNLGNTLDGHTGFTPGETVWQPTVTTQKTIDAVHDAGFSTIRVPVTWGTMIDDANGYQINEAWLSRVQDIVDYAISQDMYVIVNIHHDGAEQTGWLRIAYTGEDLEQVKEKFAAVWEQIALRFRDYDEHLIFEAMNEVCGDDPSEAGYIQDYRTIEELNQIFVDTVRATGGNNARRWLSVPPRYTNIINVLMEKYAFRMPDDPAGHLMLSVHDYDYSFGIQANMNATYWNQEKALNLSKYMVQLKEAYVDKGIPVVLGEYGAVNKNNLGNRVYYYEAMNRMCVMNGIVPVAWDIGWYDRSQNPDYTFSLFDRGTGEHLFPGLIEGILRGYYNASDSSLQRNISRIERVSATEAPTVAGFETLTAEETTVTLASGESLLLNVTGEPAKAQDTVLFSTSDPAIAAVSKNGLLEARAMGTATITATTATSGVTATIEVTVIAAEIADPATIITTDQDSYALEANAPAQIAVTLDKPEVVFYTTSDSSVVTVNTFGKLVPIGNGSATVTIQTASGLTKTVEVTVGGQVTAGASVELGIGVYYNDAVHGYYGNETSPTISVSGDGTYTLTYDAITDSTNEAKGKGVLSLANVGAIYIYDVSGATGAVASCDIHYDEILLDGEPMVINDHEPKSALKKSGKLDTNDPINAWDGSVTPDVTVTGDHVIEFINNPAPRTIQITFTLSNWSFGE